MYISCYYLSPGSLEVGNLLVRGVYRMFIASHYVHTSSAPESRLGREMLGSGPPVIPIWRLSKLKFIFGRTLNTKGGDPQKKGPCLWQPYHMDVFNFVGAQVYPGAEVRLGETDPETYPTQARTPRLICH